MPTLYTVESESVISDVEASRPDWSQGQKFRLGLEFLRSSLSAVSIQRTQRTQKENSLRKILRNARNARNARLQILHTQEIDPCSILAFPTQALTNETTAFCHVIMAVADNNNNFDEFRSEVCLSTYSKVNNDFKDNKLQTHRRE